MSEDKIKNGLTKDQIVLKEVTEKYGEDHYFSQVIKLYTEVFKILSIKELEFRNCLDLDKKNKLGKEMDELISTINSLI